MGGFGSGRPRSADKIEDHRVLDVSAMNRAGCLAGSHIGTWQWTRDGEVVASIRYRHDQEDEAMHLDFRARSAGGEWQQVSQKIRIDWRPCRFGGRRPYLACPGIRNGVVCTRRVTKLYGAGTWFLCRHCYGLGYSSQSEDPFDRALRKANRLRQSLDRDAWGVDSAPRRPKGMWRRTYQRRMDTILALDEFAVGKLAQFAVRLLKLGDAA